MIVHDPIGITLVGGGPADPQDLNTARSLAPTLVAVDAGADLCLTAGHPPDAIIGDLDSLSPAAAAAFADRLHPVTEQETTDFDKALRHVAAPLLIAVGFSGGRLDHELAALSGLLRAPAQPCLILGAESLTFLCPPVLTLDLPAGLPLSLFPMGPAPLRSTGLRWPTDGLDFRPDGRIGTSNAVAGGAPVILRAETPQMLVIVPRQALDAAATALSAAERWPQSPPSLPPAPSSARGG